MHLLTVVNASVQFLPLSETRFSDGMRAFQGNRMIELPCTTGRGLGFGNLFKGYDLITFLVVANLAFSGLLVSWVMKFADSIMKASTFVADMLLTTVISNHSAASRNICKILPRQLNIKSIPFEH